MATITTSVDNETSLKLARRAERVGMTPLEVVKILATKGVEFFLRELVAPTKTAARNWKGERV